MHDWLHVDDSNCEADSKAGAKPAAGDSCTVNCWYVNPASGSDSANDGTTGNGAFESVSKCIEAANSAQSAFSVGKNETLVTKCLLAEGRYTEGFPIEIPAQSRNLIIEPVSYKNYNGSPVQRAGDYGVIFDGTDDISNDLTFTEGLGTSTGGGDTILIKAEIPASAGATKVSEVIVDDESMQCPDEYVTNG